MSMKIKGFGLESNSRMKEEKAWSRHQSLMQDYEDLQKEVDAMRSHLDAAKHRKLVLAAEVRFLRRRRRLLVEARATHSIQETHPHQQPKKITRKKQPVARKEAATKPSLPSLAANPKKQRKVPQQLPPPPNSAAKSLETNRARKKTGNMGVPDLNRRATARITPSGSKAVGMRIPVIAFDLNQETAPPHVRDPSSSSSLRLAPVFDLNEVSTGDEDFCLNADVEEQRSDLKLSLVCRNSGEGSSRAGKRKISWQDPVALRV